MPLTFSKLPLNLKILIFGLSVLTFGITQQNVLITDNTSIAPDASSLLDLNSTSKGVLVPRMTTAQRDQISNPANGLLVFDTDVKCFTYYSSTTSTWSFLCNTGTGGTNTILTTSVSPGANCANGGVLLQFGNDTNGDGILNPSEINTSLDQYVCNGTQGAQGVQGTQGPQGIQGIQGPAGTNASLPAGIIVMWSGTLATVPSGWALCDGTNGTPDLMDRFVVSARFDAGGGGNNISNFNIGHTGGANSVTITTNNLPSHTHSIGGSTGGQSVSHTHAVSITTSGGDHTHTYDKGISGGDVREGTGGQTYPLRSVTPTNTSGTGAHSHTVSGNTGNASVDHTHTLPANTGATGGGVALNILPPYYALAYIMKL
jgi:microcystin-dependent protein